MSKREDKSKQGGILLQGVKAAVFSAVLLFAGLLAFENTARGQEATKVTWAIDSFLATLPQRVAEELGYYEEEGVDIELRVGAMGIDTMDAIIAGEADLGVGAHWALVNRMTKPNIGLGGFILAWRVPVNLMVSPEIQELSDLKGKRIAVIQGSVWDWFLQKALDAGGVNRDEVEQRNFGSPVDYLAAAVRGDVDAGWFWETNLVKAREVLEPKGWRSIATRKDVAPEVAIEGHGPLPINIKSAEEKPEALAGALRAYNRAADWCSANADKCAEMANKLMGSPIEETKKLLPDLGFYIGISEEHVQLMKEMKQFALDQGFMKQDDDYDFDSKVITGPLDLARQ